MAEAATRYHTACPTLKAFIRQRRITLSADWADSNPNIDSMPPGSRALALHAALPRPPHGRLLQPRPGDRA